MTTVTITDRGLYGYNHAGKTGVCIAVSQVLQVAARILDAADLVESAYMDREPPRYAIEVAEASQENATARAVFAGAFATLREIEKMNPDLLQVTDKRGERTIAEGVGKVHALHKPVSTHHPYSQEEAVRREQSATAGPVWLPPAHR
jgi:uncharacterized protein YsxB (DUF464 family)